MLFLEWMSLSEEDRLSFGRVSETKSRDFCLQLSFSLAEVFTGSPGKLVDLRVIRLKGFDAMVCKRRIRDHLPEAAFYMVGWYRGG